MPTITGLVLGALLWALIGVVNAYVKNIGRTIVKTVANDKSNAVTAENGADLMVWLLIAVVTTILGILFGWIPFLPVPWFK